MTRSRISRTALGVVTTVVLVLGCLSFSAVAAQASTPWPGHPGRHLVWHKVVRGDTATGLAVRYHAWTRELLAINHLRATSILRVGERIRIPVVNSAVRHHKAHHKKHRRTHHTTGHQHRTHRAKHPWRHTSMSRDQVRRVITRRAHAADVPADLALAVAWVESGWQQRLISSAGAVGVMQLLPATGAWMSYYAGHRLNVYGTYNNIRGGVLLLNFLRAHTRKDRHAIGAYYQGLGAVQRRGLYKETRHYVDVVKAVRENLRRTGHPTR